MALPESVQEILKRMTPPWAKKAGEALPYVAAPLGVMGSELLSAGSKTLRFLGAGLPVSPEEVENMRQTNRNFLSETYGGVPGAEKATPSPQEKVIPKANTPAIGSPTETNVVAASNAQAPTDIYGAVEMMDDANFKKFVDKHPNIPGIGYIKGKGVDFQRVIEKPSNDSNDVDLSGMPVSAAADLIRAVSAKEQSQSIKESQLEDKKANTEIRRENLQNQIEKTWESQYKGIDPTTGKPVMNNDEAVARTIFNGDRLPESKAAMQNKILPKINSFFAKWYKDNAEDIKKRNLDQETINALAQKAYLKRYHPKEE
jgi:hypothetical protein